MCKLSIVKTHLFDNEKEPNFQVWKGSGERDSLDGKWEKTFRFPREGLDHTTKLYS
jgi:hypothetical protein